MGAIGGLVNFPTLETVANLTRSIVDDDKAGLTGTPGEGQILTDSSPMLINFMNSAIREMYRDARIMGDPTLIKDNYLLLSIPPVNSSLGVSVPNPAVQVAIQATGFFDGLEMNAGLGLPTDFLYPMDIWQRQSGTEYSFTPMPQSTGPLPSFSQGAYMGLWEYRNGAIWMNGSIYTMDLRLRYMASLADLANSSAIFATTYIPIPDCQDCLADKIAVRVARRLGADPGTMADLIQQAKDSLMKLSRQVVLNRQLIPVTRPAFQGGSGWNLWC